MDEQIIRRFKKFQQETGKYLDLDIEQVAFERKKLEKLVKNSIKSGGTPPTKNRKLWKSDFELIDNENYFGWRNIDKSVFETGEINTYSNVITKEGFNRCSTWLVPENSILIAIASASKGLIAINRKAMCTNQNILGVIPKNNISVVYLYFSLHEIYSNLKNKKEFGNLTKSSEKQREINIPKPLNEKYTSLQLQNVLVDFIEYYKKDNEEKLAVLKKINHLAKDLERFVVPLFFRKEVSAAKRFNQFCTENDVALKLDEMEFEEKRIISNNPSEVICEKRMGFTPKTSVNGDINWYTISDLTNVDGFFITQPNTRKKTSMALVRQKISENSSKFKPIQMGDVLISFKLTVGITKIYDSELPAYCNEAIDILTADEEVLPIYLAYNCMIEYNRHAEKTNNGYTLNDDLKKKVVINIPVETDQLSSKQIQEHITVWIENYFQQINNLKKTIKELKRLLALHTKVLIHKTFNP